MTRDSSVGSGRPPEKRLCAAINDALHALGSVIQTTRVVHAAAVGRDRVEVEAAGGFATDDV